LVFLSQPFARYVLALIPFLAIGSGYFIFECLLPLANRRLVKILIICFFMLPFVFLLMKAIKLDMLFVSKDTRVESAKWIRQNMPLDAIFALDHSFFRPAINQNIIQFTEKQKLINKQQGLANIKEKKYNLRLASYPGNGYYIYFLSTSPDDQGQFFSTMPALGFNLEELKKRNIKYIVINYATRPKDAGIFYAELKKNATLVKSFSPYKNGAIRFSYDTSATTCMPYLSRELYSRIESGPALEIYKLER
jgi:hypothetical protein